MVEKAFIVDDKMNSRDQKAFQGRDFTAPLLEENAHKIQT